MVTLQLVDALVSNGGFEAMTDRDLLRAAREASEIVAAPEHRALLESGDTEQWLALQGLLHDRLRAYVESHEREFFIDSDEAATTAGRVKATFAAQDAWLTRTIEEIDREVSTQEWLVQRFADRGIYSQASELLLLRPADMRQALRPPRTLVTSPPSLRSTKTSTRRLSGRRSRPIPSAFSTLASRATQRPGSQSSSTRHVDERGVAHFHHESSSGEGQAGEGFPRLRQRSGMTSERGEDLWVVGRLPIRADTPNESRVVPDFSKWLLHSFRLGPFAPP